MKTSSYLIFHNTFKDSGAGVREAHAPSFVKNIKSAPFLLMKSTPFVLVPFGNILDVY